MTERAKESIFKGVELHAKTNNAEHRTDEISEEQLIVRRGQPFKLTLNLTKPFVSTLHSLIICTMTGKNPSEDRGTMSFMSLPESVSRSTKAKAAWKLMLDKSSSPSTGVLILIVTPPADAPIGEYNMTVKHGEEETVLALLAVLFNPWCPKDSVFMPVEEDRQEYVMNEQGIVYRGSGNYIFPLKWDFGQFEDSMVTICMKMLDKSHKHLEDPAADVAARSDPIYVSRIVSAMINSEDDHGVLEGRWGGPYSGGQSPSHWSGSHDILQQWLKSNCHPVKYGQCWVFACVMCSVMRLLGIPCRVVTNFESAHDCNSNLTIDEYHADYGVSEKESPDSVWNFHVWTEGFMKRQDLPGDGKFDGWQVLDPTPQEMSDGVYCCGPASVKAIFHGETAQMYDVPFVFAEVNADCVDWLLKKDGTKVKIWSDTQRVGQNISTKAVGSDTRLDITDTYKHKEGSAKERSVFKYACTRDYSKGAEEEVADEEAEEEVTNEEAEEEVADEEAEEEVADEEAEEEVTNEEAEEEGEDAVTEGNDETPDSIPPEPPLTMKFEEVTIPKNGQDVGLKLVLHSESTAVMKLHISISVQAMTYNNKVASNIQEDEVEKTLQPGDELSVPIKVPFSVYKKTMLDCDTMKITAIVTDLQNPENVFLGEDDVVLQDPPILVTAPSEILKNVQAIGQVVFRNPVDETLTNCTLTLTGSGLWKEEIKCDIPDLTPNSQVRATFYFVPFKKGTKTVMVDFDCSVFRDIKGSCTVTVKESTPA